MRARKNWVSWHKDYLAHLNQAKGQGDAHVNNYYYVHYDTRREQISFCFVSTWLVGRYFCNNDAALLSLSLHFSVGIRSKQICDCINIFSIFQHTHYNYVVLLLEIFTSSFDASTTHFFFSFS